MNDGTEWIKSRKEMEAGELAPQPHSAENLLREIVAYASDIDGLYKSMAINANPEKPTWRIFAQILADALIYE